MMKRLLSVALSAAILLCAPAFAQNDATAQTALPIRVGGAGYVVPYLVDIDTVDTDLTIVTPATGKMACVVGAFGAETSATNVTFKSGTTTQVIPELATNQGFLLPIANHALVCSQPGEALKIAASVAISSLILYIVQASYLDFTGG
jgi:hypothetical protein